MMDYPCGKFGDYVSCLGSIMRTDTQTHIQTRTNATLVDVSKYTRLTIPSMKYPYKVFFIHHHDGSKQIINKQIIKIQVKRERGRRERIITKLQ